MVAASASAPAPSAARSAPRRVHRPDVPSDEPSPSVLSTSSGDADRVASRDARATTPRPSRRRRLERDAERCAALEVEHDIELVIRIARRAASICIRGATRARQLAASRRPRFEQRAGALDDADDGSNCF